MAIYIDSALNHDSINIFFTLFAGVLMGYALEPVPKFADYLFKNSFVIRTLIMIVMGILIFGKSVKISELLLIIGASLIIQIMYTLSRKYDNTILRWVGGAPTAPKTT